MPASGTPFQRLAEIEQELSTALSEYPDRIALDRLKYVRGLVRLVRTQLELEQDDATIPVLNDVDQVRRAGL